MKKKSTGYLIAIVIWSLVIAVNLLNQDFNSISISDYIQNGLFLATIIALLFPYFKERKKERANG